MTQMSRLLTGAAFLAAIALAPYHAFAQGATPMPLSRATVSDEVAKRTLFKNQLSSTLARDIVNACVEFARNQQGGPGKPYPERDDIGVVFDTRKTFINCGGNSTKDNCGGRHHQR